MGEEKERQSRRGLTYPPEVTLALVPQGRILLSHAKAVPSTGVDLTGVQPLAAVEAAEPVSAGARVAVGYQLADTPIGTGVVITDIL